MKIKFMIMLLLFNIFLYCGCEMNNLNNTKKPTTLTISDIKQLVGVTYGDVEKIYGSPEKSTYYIKLNDLSNINKNYISLRDFNHNSIIEAYYSISDEDTYIILWYKNNKVVKSSFNESDIINNSYIHTNNNHFDIKINYYKNASHFKNVNLNKFKNYIGSNIKILNNKYNLICPKISANLLNKNEVLYFYDIKDDNNNSLFIASNNNIISKISIIKSSKACETIIYYIK